MDSFIFDFHTDSTSIDEENNSPSDLDWTAFQPAAPLPVSAPTSSTLPVNPPFEPIWISQQDDAVAPNNQTTTITPPPTADENQIYVDIEHFFNGFPHHHPQQQQQQQQQQPQLPVQPIQQQEIIEPIHVNINIPDQTMNEREHIESSSRAHVSLVINERPMSCASTPSARLSSSRSQCYHKLPDRAVKLMQEWYNANLDDPYPRSPDKKRFITEGNITAQQCRSWFANRRQRLKHVKKNLSKSSTSSRSHPYLPAKLTQAAASSSLETSPIPHEHCYYCQQQQQPQQMALSPSSTTTTTTLNVVINQQTVEQLIHNSLRKLLYPALM